MRRYEWLFTFIKTKSLNRLIKRFKTKIKSILSFRFSTTVFTGSLLNRQTINQSILYQKFYTSSKSSQHQFHPINDLTQKYKKKPTEIRNCARFPPHTYRFIKYVMRLPKEGTRCQKSNIHCDKGVHDSFCVYRVFRECFRLLSCLNWALDLIPIGFGGCWKCGNCLLENAMFVCGF